MSDEIDRKSHRVAPRPRLPSRRLWPRAAQACHYTGAEQVFKPWGDLNSYVLAPDGGFEAGGPGWYLGGGAKTVSGNESF